MVWEDSWPEPCDEPCPTLLPGADVTLASFPLYVIIHATGRPRSARRQAHLGAMSQVTLALEVLAITGFLVR